VDFADWVGIGSLNILNSEFSRLDQIPRVLDGVMGFCVTAAKVDPRSCPFGVPSLKASNPESDIQSRVDHIINSLSNASFIGPQDTGVFTFYDLADLIGGCLYSPSQFPILAAYLLEAENSIKSGKVGNFSLLNKRSTVDGQNTNITYSSLNPNATLAGMDNPFLFYGVVCLESNFTGIDNPVAFGNQVSALIDKNPLVGYFTIDNAVCLGWPDLSSFDVERFEGPFPANFTNKILVIGGTNDPITPYHGALSTYEYIGSENANFLIHDGYGHCALANPNNCTNSAIGSFLRDGKSFTKCI
jgi:hypothetical protein